MSENTEDTSEIVITSEIIRLIKAIPRGKVATYGQIACLTGLYASVRRVVWILHSCSKKEGLPWHRVVNRRGTISLKPGAGYEKQKEMLKREGIVFDEWTGSTLSFISGNRMMRTLYNYSYRSESTGLARAALMDW